MTTTTRKPDLQAQFMEAELENCRGRRNVHFTATGKTIYGIYLHETKQKAVASTNKAFNLIREQLRVLGESSLNGAVILEEDLPMTTIQIPEA